MNTQELQEIVRQFKEHLAKIDAYNHAMGVLSFDAETIMPRGGSQARGEVMGALSEVCFKLTVNDELRDMLQKLSTQLPQLDEVTRCEVEKMQEDLDKLSRVPVKEYVAFTIARNDATNAWREAKQKDDFSLFAPHLQQMIDYTRKFAAYQKPNMPVYDALLDDYERGLTVEKADQFFDAVQQKVAPLIRQVLASGQIKADFLARQYPVHLQRELSDALMQMLCVDRNHCAIAETEHPFTTNFSKHDVRITTHYYEHEVTSNLFSVIHESGHALYELHTGDELLGSPLAAGVSMGVHESQSRFFENIIGRSRPFSAQVFHKMQALFPEQMCDVDEELFYRAVNLSRPSLVRTEADELTYPMHILIRYQLEKRIFAGEMTVEQLPKAWNALYKEYLGVEVPNDTMGVLQDTHWAGAMFGYFPSYAIGSAYAAQILPRMEQDIPVWELVSRGELAPIIDWLTQRIYRFGSMKKPTQLMEEVFGAPFDPHYYIDYLTKKYSELYGFKVCF